MLVFNMYRDSPEPVMSLEKLDLTRMTLSITLQHICRTKLIRLVWILIHAISAVILLNIWFTLLNASTVSHCVIHHHI